jgi:hypothetical protein
LAASLRKYRRTVLREHPTCLAIALNPSPRRAITRISTACSWVNIGSLKKAAILAQLGQFYFVDGVSITLAVTITIRKFM